MNIILKLANQIYTKYRVLAFLFKFITSKRATLTIYIAYDC